MFRSLGILLIHGTVLLCGVAGAADGTASSHPSDADRVASNAISAHAARVHGSEYADHREWAAGDVNGDGRVDYVVLYTIENGNNYSTYLVALLQEGRGYRAIAPVKVGGRGERFVHLDSIAGGRIKLHVERFAASDPFCCPSLKGATEFSLKNGSLSEKAAPTERKHRPEPPSQVDAKPQRTP